jgi:hypothetical protein
MGPGTFKASLNGMIAPAEELAYTVFNEVSMNNRWIVALWLLTAAVVGFGAGPLSVRAGGAGPTENVRGKIVSVQSQDLTVASAGGNIQVKVPDTAIIRGETSIKFADLTSGMYLGTTAAKQSDGIFRASEVHVFSADQRGTGEGHRPSSSIPNSTMTNANVARVEDVAVQDIKGRLMTLQHKGGEVKVFVPPDIPIVKRAIADRTLLKPGAEVSIQATHGADNSLTASQITVRASGR